MPRARWRLINATRALQPLRQGELNGLCGLYSIINAVRLALYPRQLRKPEIKLLFEAGLRVLSASKRLRYIVADGMYDDMWERMVAAVLVQLALKPGEQLILADLLAEAKVATTPEAHRAIRHALHQGTPTLLNIARAYGHWTVVGRHTRSRYYLFDSSAYHWIGVDNLELDDIDTGATHGLVRAMALRPR